MPLIKTHDIRELATYGANFEKLFNYLQFTIKGLNLTPT